MQVLNPYAASTTVCGSKAQQRLRCKALLSKLLSVEVELHMQGVSQGQCLGQKQGSN